MLIWNHRHERLIGTGLIISTLNSELVRLALKNVRLQLKERDTIRRFRECLIEMTVPERAKHLKSALSMRPVSSGEYEQVFSRMNLIVSKTRASLMTKTVVSLLFLKIV
jgi:hypothetical protein